MLEACWHLHVPICDIQWVYKACNVLFDRGHHIKELCIRPGFSNHLTDKTPHLNISQGSLEYWRQRHSFLRPPLFLSFPAILRRFPLLFLLVFLQAVGKMEQLVVLVLEGRR